ncbi:MAG TPA: hypothetical protein VL358_13300 [Caulobacteraceae bacterium]|jgi:hypothetical protein|nr:hypothetical protein [Caulobacteraceae bacterium]
MNRKLMSLSALAAAVVLAAPALAEDSVRVPVVGKSPAEAYAAIVAAARSVCRGIVPGDPHGLYVSEACVQASVDAAITQAKIPALTQYAKGAVRDLHLASN